MFKYIKDFYKRSNPFIKKNLKYIILGFFIALLFIGYFSREISSVEGDTLKRLEVALKEESAEKLSDIVFINGDKIPVEKLLPLIEYFEGDSYKIDLTISNLKKTNISEEFILKEKKVLFFKRYTLEPKTYSIKLNSNYEDAELKLQNYDFVASGSTIDNIIPGVYDLEGKVQGDYGIIKTSKKILVMKDTNEFLNIEAVNISIDSEFEDAVVFVNNKSTNIMVKDFKNIGPFPIDKSVSIHIEKDTNWGNLISEEVKVSSVPNIYVDLSIQNDKLKDILKENVTSFYQSVFEALNKKDKSKIVFGSEEAKERIYSILEKKYIFLENKYTINSIEVDEDKSLYEFKDNKYRATIVVDVDYKTQKKLFGINPSNNSKFFFTRMVFEDDIWKIEDVSNFEL